MCLSKLKKWFCGECKPEVVEKIVEVEKPVFIEKIVEKEVKLPVAIVNDSLPLINKKITPSYNKTDNKKVCDYFFSLLYKGDYYSQYKSINTIKINKNEKCIVVDKKYKLYPNGDFLA